MWPRDSAGTRPGHCRDPPRRRVVCDEPRDWWFAYTGPWSPPCRGSSVRAAMVSLGTPHSAADVHRKSGNREGDRECAAGSAPAATVRCSASTTALAQSGRVSTTAGERLASNAALTSLRRPATADLHQRSLHRRLPSRQQSLPEGSRRRTLDSIGAHIWKALVNRLLLGAREGFPIRCDRGWPLAPVRWTSSPPVQRHWRQRSVIAR
jgi:hypothetical protein